MNYLILQPLCEIDNVIPMVQMGKIELSKFLELTNGGFWFINGGSLIPESTLFSFIHMPYFIKINV